MGNKSSKSTSGLCNSPQENRFEDSGNQKRNNILLVIDPQVDFHPGGSLAVGGANEDTARIADLITNNLEDIDEIYITLDTHHRTHIAHGIFWENATGESPPPFTLITHDDVVTGKWSPKNKTLLDHAKKYTKYLADQGKFTLCIWPEHCLIGTTGHAVVPELNAALHRWAEVRNKEIHYVWKGENSLTEMYSAIKADYEIPSDPRTQLDPKLIEQLKNTERLLIGGQALSHCVNFTFTDILNTWPKDQTSSLVLLTDGCSPVGGFEAQAVEFVERIKQRGCTLLKIAEVFPKA